MSKLVAARSTTNGVQYYDETDLAFMAVASGVYTVTSESRVIDMNTSAGTREIDLPLLAGIDQGRVVTIKDGLGTADQDNPITIVPAGNDVIDGRTEPFRLTNRYGAVTVMATSIGWSITNSPPTEESVQAAQFLLMDSATALDEGFDERTMFQMQQ